jgi:hypothetical protein
LVGGGALAFPRASAVTTAATTADLAVSASTTAPATTASGAAEIDALTMVAAVGLNIFHFRRRRRISFVTTSALTRLDTAVSETSTSPFFIYLYLQL